MDTKYSGDIPTPQSRDGREETLKITRIYKTKCVTRPTTATLPKSITGEGKANGRESSKRWDEEKREKERVRAQESRLSRGKRRAPATSSLTAVNGRSLRRNTVRERSRKNKRPRQMDEDGKMGWEKEKGRRWWGQQREKRKRKRRYLYYSKKSDRENRETGRLRPWQLARTSEDGGTENYTRRTVGCTNGTHGARKGRYSIQFKGHARRSIASRSFSMQNKILQIRRKRSHMYTRSRKHTHPHIDEKMGGRKVFFFWMGRGECHEVGSSRSRNSKEHTRRRWNIRYREFDISLGRTRATAIRIPAYFRRCFGGFRITQSVTNGSLKYTERVGSFSFSLPLPVLPTYLSIYLSLSPSLVLRVSRQIQSRFIFTRNSIEVHR